MSMKFKIINPSDPYEMIADDLKIAAVAISFLGCGKYALKGTGNDNTNDVPLFLLGDHDEWFISKFGMSFHDTADHVLKHEPEKLAAALNSVTLMCAKRSSLNDIGRSAKELADAVLRKTNFAASGKH